MPNRFILAAVFTALIGFFPVGSIHARGTAPSYIKAYIPKAEIVGQGRLTYMVWDVYDATLYAPVGRYSDKRPTALSLRYLRNLKGRDIADTSVAEIRAQGFNDEVTLASWHEQMRRIFPDVTTTTVLTGIRTVKGETVFLQNGRKIGTITDKRFGTYFFNIWLGDTAKKTDLRDRLLGQF